MSMLCDDHPELGHCCTVNNQDEVLVDKLDCLALHTKTKQLDIEKDQGKDEDASDSGHSESPKIQSRPRRIHKSNSISGILKYPPGWKRRTYSESSALAIDRTLSNDGGYFEEAGAQDEDDADDELEGERQKKCVTFSSKNAIFVFRPNSSILGRRLKNQKKAKKRKERMLRDGSLSSPGSDAGHEGQHFHCDSSGCSSAESSSVDASSSSCGESSGDEMSAAEAKSEFKLDQVCESKEDAKGKRKNRRKRNRKSKQALKTNLEIGGYDSE